MRPHEIENWVLSIVDRVEHHLPNEDSRVELKSEWIDPQKAARQIAAHANAAGGDPILWVIGVDQQRGIVGVNHAELANWFAAVKAQFDGLAPQLTDLNVPTKSGTVVALLFETDRSPFVVKNPAFGQQGGGSVQYEVPWRENTSTRSATRSELIRLLTPLQKLPDFEILDASLSVDEVPYETDPGEELLWSLRLELYAVPKMETQVVIPFHRCRGSLEVQGSLKRTPLKSFGPHVTLDRTIASGKQPTFVWATHSEFVISRSRQD